MPSDQWPEGVHLASVNVEVVVCREGGGGVKLKDHIRWEAISLDFSSPNPAHKEPGKARANSLVCLGSQRASGPFHKQVTIARQASLPGSPEVLRNPLLRQRRVGVRGAPAFIAKVWDGRPR